MSDPILPPPLPKPPFPRAVDETTAPGLGPEAQVLSLQRTLKRVRAERDDALSSLRDSTPPPRTRKQKAVKTTLSLGKWTVLVPLILILGAYAKKRWPQFGELIDNAMQALPQ